ncbi:DUF4082 domain-containing protein [Falsirhodobacter algicola]|uniref:DUF4082 domain-containing protein n=1 Tax=Falsirhodobacter algicola TaxID=2692330 RepID=A0A8J8MRZ2_9RHOB|nr:DUF4082 domain-containing protein [Falsirhodobacter algicola]QUS35687.1 DUF4082 domain-containing protein [Falsirhodobacter algicola]
MPPYDQTQDPWTTTEAGTGGSTDEADAGDLSLQPVSSPSSDMPTPLILSPGAPVVVADTGADAGGGAAGTSGSGAIDWRAAADLMACGSCTGRFCTVCSIRTGADPGTDGKPSGYSAKVLDLYSPGSTAATDSTAKTSLEAEAVNAIVLENQKQGSPESEWLIGTGDSSIEGYAAQFSLNHGETVDFKIRTDSTDYRIDIYRIGYYGGDGARLVQTIDRKLGTAQGQPDPLFDPETKLVDAGNWDVSASWDIPADAVSGVYYAVMTRNDGSGGRNMIPFVVRDDEAKSDITFQTSDTTWQAYNWWGGYNFYGGIDAEGREGRASKLSYNRPIITRDGGYAAGPQDFIFGVEYPTIRWLEQNGYDVNYISGIDTDRDASALLDSKVFLSVGHDEYWSAAQRANVEAARDAGVNLAFLSGNEVYWETRWETSIDGSGTPYRTLVSYKERWDNDDTDVGNTTSTWRDPQYGSGLPENALTGTMFTVDTYRLDTIEVPYDLSNFRFWTNTAVADIAPGEVYELTKNLLGYEWDSDVDNGFRPAGLIQLSNTTVDVQSLLLDYGNTTGEGTATHALTLYRAASGALVFGAGSVYWSWGLDDHHDNEATPTDPNVQQAMVNLFADMGVQPSTLMASLMAATQTGDRVAPVSRVTLPEGPFRAGQSITLTGTATDTGGGSVAVVEVSTDGGQRWHRATGYTNWSYTWTPLAGGTFDILTRAVDDSVNLETPGAPTSITIEAAPTVSVFQPSAQPDDTSSADTGQVNLGMSFTSSEAGSIVGMRYYKGLGDGGTHVGSVWAADGTLLKSATFSADGTEGWQTVSFDSPLQVAAGVTYVASYTSHGHYASTENFFTGPVTNGALTAQSGYYVYNASTAFPIYQANTNYWVDVIFSPTNTENQVPVGVNDNGYLATRNTPITFTAASLLANDSDANGDILSITGTGSAVGGTVSYNAASQIVTFTPTAGYTGAAHFGYAISDGRGGIGSAFVNMQVVAPYESLFGGTGGPAVTDSGDSAAVTLGTAFTASGSGTISGLRFFKGAQDLGTHTGTLWRSDGTILASGTFTNESASGWQTLVFSSPISIAAGQSYVAGYASNGHYTTTSGFFDTAWTSGGLTATAGVYSYGNGTSVPTSSYAGSNYWVDVLYNPAAPGQNLSPVAADDSGYSTQTGTPLVIAGAQLLANDSDPEGQPLTITGVGGAANGTVALNAATGAITFTPQAGYTGAAGFTYTISDGAGGTASAAVNLSVTEPPTYDTLFATSAVPGTVQVNDPASVELGMAFTAARDGEVSGIRFYKGAQNTGPHTGTLWTADGAVLGTVSFTNESASGWQMANLATPLTVTAGTSYVVSYHTSGNYSSDAGYFNAPVTNGALTGTSGVYGYGAAGTFPNQSYNNSNYWVDVAYTPSAAANQAPVATPDNGLVAAAGTPLQIAVADLLANDTDVDGDTLSITAVGGARKGSVRLDADAGIVTFTPTTGATGAAGFSYTLSDGRGGTATGDVALAIRSGDAAESLFAANAAPTVVDSGDASPVELGMRFTAASAGEVLGVKFYKGAQNTGTHSGSLWTATGTRLATVSFTNETASGWQTANFDAPVTVDADTNYVVSYHTDGRYAVDANYFAQTVARGSLTASGGGNGVYAYGSDSAFPTGSYNNSNYWVDVVFSSSLVA